MNNKDIYNYYMKKVYNEDIGLALEIGKHFVVKGATDIASKYTGLNYGDPTKDNYEKQKQLKIEKEKQKVDIVDFLTTKFTSMEAIPSSIKNRPIRFLKYIILEYILISNGYIKKEKTNMIQDYIFENNDGKELLDELENTSLNKFILNKTSGSIYVGTIRIAEAFNDIELTQILQKVNTNNDIFKDCVNKILKPEGGILKQGFNYDELKKVYDQSSLENLIFTSEQLTKDKR